MKFWDHLGKHFVCLENGGSDLSDETDDSDQSHSEDEENEDSKEK